VGPVPWGGGGGRGWASGQVGVDCMRDLFILNEIWAQGKIYILIGTLLGCNILLITYS
jgi:hypothetical protein